MLWKDSTVRILTPALLALILTASCSAPAENQGVIEISSAEMITLSQDLATYQESISPRVAAVGNGSAEILVAMGRADLLVGRDIASEIDQLRDVPIVTNGHEISAERVLGVDPDLLIIDPNSSPKSAISQIKDAGVRVVQIPESYSIDGMREKVRSIAQAIGDPKRGELLNQEISRAIDSMVSEDQQSLDVLFLYLRGSNGIFLVGGRGSGADALIEAAGARDIGSSLYQNPFTPINSEAILGLEPDRYLLMSAGLASVGGIEAFRDLPGIDRQVPVITVDDSLLLSFGPRTPDLIRQLSEAIHDNS